MGQATTADVQSLRGRVYYDPQGRRITVGGVCPLWPDGEYIDVRREDGHVWAVETGRLQRALAQKGA